jgi:hypothetical protein
VNSFSQLADDAAARGHPEALGAAGGDQPLM